MQTKKWTKTQPTRQLESQRPLSQSPSQGDGPLTESDLNTGREDVSEQRTEGSGHPQGSQQLTPCSTASGRL